jgi:glycosyltransferase involved in cell wall biosynthesis
MKVLLVTGFTPSRGGGGVERHVYDLALGLIKRGVDVSIACENQQHFPGNYELIKDRLILSDIKYRNFLSPLKVSRRMANLAGACEYSAHLMKRSWVISRSFNAADYDVIHTHAQVGCIPMIKNRLHPGKKPHTVTTLHGTAAGFFDRMRQYHMGPAVPTPEVATSMLMEYLSVRSSDACIAVSEFVGSVAERSYRAPADRVHVIYNWADGNLFHPIDKLQSRTVLGLEPDKKYLLFVGRADAMKGFNLLLDAMDYVGDKAMLLIASNNTGGQGAKIRDNVRYLGYVDEQLPLYYSACDIFAFPSLSEGMPLTMVEAMACGLVPACMRLSPMDEVAGNDTSYFCDRFDAKEYAGVLIQAIEDAGINEKSRRCVDRSRLFDMDKSIDATLDLYRSLLA